MSKSQNPMTGHMGGSMANFNTYTRYKKNIISSKAFQPRNPNTVSQIAQRASVKLISRLYRSLGGLTKKSFTDRQEDQSPYIAFIAANLPEAVDKTGATPVIDFSKLKVSSGILPPVIVPTALAGATGITLSYITDAEVPDIKPTDEVFAFAKLKTGQLIVARQVRGNEPLTTILLPYPDIAVSSIECCYLFVYNEDKSMSSESTFVLVS